MTQGNNMFTATMLDFFCKLEDDKRLQTKAALLGFPVRLGMMSLVSPDPSPGGREILELSYHPSGFVGLDMENKSQSVVWFGADADDELIFRQGQFINGEYVLFNTPNCFLESQKPEARAYIETTFVMMRELAIAQRDATGTFDVDTPSAHNLYLEDRQVEYAQIARRIIQEREKNFAARREILEATLPLLEIPAFPLALEPSPEIAEPQEGKIIRFPMERR